eukprot:TRINITY_DN13832_c0_g1_i1.p1 TRINITY_DN13832_c0_g1~~TRINITY_DN13832_c0_g1_i1.p1  ORF type:complete len:350 (+),score=43.55 TRINITY_DN13832_c0_g1_i1:390-1439(+)
MEGRGPGRRQGSRGSTRGAARRSPLPSHSDERPVIARAVLIGDLSVALWQPPYAGVALAPCQAARAASQLTHRRIGFRARRRLSWAWEVDMRWEGARAPVMFVCRDPACLPLGAEAAVQAERRIDPFDGRPATFAAFRARHGHRAAAAAWDVAKVAIPGKNASESVTATDTELQLRRAAAQSALGPLTAAAVVIETAYSGAGKFTALARQQGRLLPAAGRVRRTRSGDVNCTFGCRWELPSGPAVLLRGLPRDAAAAAAAAEGEAAEEASATGTAVSSRGPSPAALSAVVWVSDDLGSVRGTLRRAGALIDGDDLPHRYRPCVGLSLKRVGITQHTPLLFCPRGARYPR